MVQSRLVLCGIVLASLGSACTAIVLGKVSDTNDYTTTETPAAPGACDLIQEGDANTCSTCIQTSCPSDVAYACNGGTEEKGWFDDMRRCAANPQYSPFDWGCQQYQTTTAVPNDPGSDSEKEALAHNCVTNNCIQGATPACKRCDVQIQKSQNDTTYAQLTADPCGSCMATSCGAQLVTCCGTGPIADFVQKCAYTALSTNKQTCLELGKANPDAGNDGEEYDDAGTQCLMVLSQCFQQNCAQTSGCQ